MQRAGDGENFDESMLIFISSWMEHAPMIGALQRSSLSQIIYQVQIDHIEDLRRLFLKDEQLLERQQEYLANVLAAMIHAAFRIWSADMQQGPEEMLRSLKAVINTLNRMFNP